MRLKPQDIVVLLKLALHEGRPWTYAVLAQELGISPSELHSAIRRSLQAGLLGPDRRPNRTSLLEFLIHGLKYAFAPERGGVGRGVPTAHAAPPLAGQISSEGELPPVWPDPNGSVRGEALKPLFKSAPRAALNDPKLYECLALLDALRVGRARERKLATEYLQQLLGHGGREAA